MNNKLPIGLINAITTPFSKKDNVDQDAFIAHLELLQLNGFNFDNKFGFMVKKRVVCH